MSYAVGTTVLPDGTVFQRTDCKVYNAYSVAKGAFLDMETGDPERVSEAIRTIKEYSADPAVRWELKEVFNEQEDDSSRETAAFLWYKGEPSNPEPKNFLLSHGWTEADLNKN
jgi:hypothetical protein